MFPLLWVNYVWSWGQFQQGLPLFLESFKYEKYFLYVFLWDGGHKNKVGTHTTFIKENTGKFLEHAKPDYINSDNSSKILLSCRNVHLTLKTFSVCFIPATCQLLLY